MPVTSSGIISLSGDIVAEFGGTAPHALSEYYRNGGLVTAGNTNVPTSGTLAFSDFYGSTAVVNRDIRVQMSHTGSNYSGFGVTSITDRTPQSYSGTGTKTIFSPVWRAGTGYLGTSLTFGISQNEDTQPTHIELLGGTNETNVTTRVYLWNLNYDGGSGGNRSYRLNFNSNGSISSLTQTGTQYNSGIVSLATQNINSNHRWYRWEVTSPSSSAKVGTLITGQPTSLSSVQQPA